MCYTRRGKFPNKLVGDFPSLATLRAINTDTLSTSCWDGNSLSRMKEWQKNYLSMSKTIFY